MAESDNSPLCLRAPQPYLGEIADSWPELGIRVQQLVGVPLPEAWLEPLDGHCEVLWRGVRQARLAWQHHWLEPVAQTLAAGAHHRWSLEQTSTLVAAAGAESAALKTCLKEADLSLIVLHGILRRLLQERISIADIDRILTTVVENARFTREAGPLVELVRTALAPQITQRFERAPGVLDGIILSEELAQTLSESAVMRNEGLDLELDAGIGRRVLEAIGGQVRRFEPLAAPLCLLVEPRLRPVLARLCERTLPNLVVLSWNEIQPGGRQEIHATVQG